MKNYLRPLRPLSAGALFTGAILTSAISYADDTEIFFGGALAKEGIRPNVLFLLDNSESMNCTPQSTAITCDREQTGSRLSILKSSFENIIKNSHGINVGVLAMHPGDNRLVAPVKYIDEVTTNIPQLKSRVEVQLRSSKETALQTADNSNNTLNHNSFTLDGTNTTGLRFKDVPVPKGAKIKRASISFVPSKNSNANSSITIKVLQKADALAFNTNASERLRLLDWATLHANWSPNGAWEQDVRNDPTQDADVTQLVQSLVNHEGWCGNNALAFSFTGTSSSGVRTVHTNFNPNKDIAPILDIEYEPNTQNGCFNPIVEIPINAASDDAIQIGTGKNRTPVYPITDGESLSFSETSSYIGARFNGIPVKREDEIISAELVSLALSGPSSNAPAKVQIQNSASPNTFTTTNNNISSRSIISNPPTCDFSISSAPQNIYCDVTSNINTVTDLSGWRENNSIAFIIKPDSTANTTLKAFNQNNTSNSLRLRIKLKYISTTYRDELNAYVQNLEVERGTPIVSIMKDATTYVRNEALSPIESACQPTHFILLSDGEAYNDSNSSLPFPKAPSCTGTGSQKCGLTLAEYLSTTDQAPWITEAKNPVTTHSIGFALNSKQTPNTCNFSGGNSSAAQFLCEISEKGQGGYYSAANSSELTDTFNTIIRNVISTDATFVSASAPVNTFNRLDNKDELYFSIFRPMETDSWPGNLKRYKLDINSAQILDSTGSLAVDPLTGYFSTTSRSFWSDSVDGNLTSSGGAASKIPAPNLRKAYTYLGSSPNKSDLRLITNSTDFSTALGSSSAAETTALITYILGEDTNKNQRKIFGDPLHSSPRIVTYKKDDDSVIFGTNEGFIHVVSTKTGQEQLAFMPKVLLKNISKLKNNSKTFEEQRPYGMDNSVTIWANDADNNGEILGSTDSAQSGEFVYAYATMGRGGKDIYALDITNRSQPKLLWQILGGNGGTAGFERLGQTWSEPVKAKIKLGSATTDVLIFAGGYDEANDDQEEDETDYKRLESSIGSDLYIVNAKTGALLWSASANNIDMKYSIPSKVSVIDLQKSAAGTLTYDSEGLADQIFVGDMGGQIWRFYINNQDASKGLVTPANGTGLFATLGGNGVDARRFYHYPDIALLRSGGQTKLAVSIGSGYRGHPLHKVIKDRYYSIHTTTLVKDDEALKDSSGNTISKTFTESDLADLTNITSDDQYNTDGVKTASGTTSVMQSKHGWLIKLNDKGEKVLSASLTVNGHLYFNTYEPTARSGSCQASVGLNRAYKVSLLDARPIHNQIIIDGTHINRFQEITTSGLLPDPTLVSIDNKNVLVRFPSIEEVPSVYLGETYWMDTTELE